MKKLFIFCFALVAISCSATKPVFHSFDNCPIPQTKFIVDKSYDVVWDNVIDFFAYNNLSIQTIEKVSGIIYTNRSSFKPAYWFPDTKSYGDPNAHIAVQYRSDYKKDGTGLTATAIWNVRVKKIDENKTEISINISDPKIEAAIYVGLGQTTSVVQTLQARSTGVFEKRLVEYFSK